jgi:ferredoxin
MFYTLGMRVSVNPEVCDANAVCVNAAPDVFELLDEGVLRILLPEPPPEHQDAVQNAVSWCPKQALRFVESED